MKFFKYFVVFVVILALVIPADAGWFRRVARKVKKVVKKVGKAIKKVTCKVLWGVVCPVGVTGAGVGLGAAGVPGPVVGVSVALGKHGCRVQRKKHCKRSVDMRYEMIPFSDEMSDYDMNNDKHISYYEFVMTVLKSVDLEDPNELLEPFMFSDFNGDGELDTDEFKGAPLLFGHAYRSRNISELDYDNYSPAAA